MIRNIRHSLSMLLSLAALALVPANPAVIQAAEIATRMELPAPNKTGGMPLMQALNARHSTKTNYSGAALSAQQLSDLLWATWGTNREDGRRTAPTAMNKQDVRVYVALENGVWQYDAGHALIKVLDGDWRGQMGGGSLTLLYAIPQGNEWGGRMWARSTRMRGCTAPQQGWETLCTFPACTHWTASCPCPKAGRSLSFKP